MFAPNPVDIAPPPFFPDLGLKRPSDELVGHVFGAVVRACILIQREEMTGRTLNFLHLSA